MTALDSSSGVLVDDGKGATVSLPWLVALECRQTRFASEEPRSIQMFMTGSHVPYLALVRCIVDDCYTRGKRDNNCLCWATYIASLVDWLDRWLLEAPHPGRLLIPQIRCFDSHIRIASVDHTDWSSAIR